MVTTWALTIPATMVIAALIFMTITGVHDLGLIFNGLVPTVVTP
jgi:hypothetical protein